MPFSSKTGLALALLGAAIPGGAALAGPGGPVVYSGFDSGAGPSDPRPNSNAAAASFDAAAASVGTSSLITFESDPVGGFTTLTVAPGVTVTSTDAAIENAPNPSAPALYGYNTTAGGQNFLQPFSPATFNFSTPIDAFGAYFSGVQNAFGTTTITFTDGTSQTIPVTSPTSNAGGVGFTGFTDQGKLISSITISPQNDAIGVDDVRFVAPASTPEPSSFAAFGFVGLGLAGLALKARKKAAAQA